MSIYTEIIIIMIVFTQAVGFLFDLVEWGMRKKHPARIEKSEHGSYPEYLTILVWHHSRSYKGYVRNTFVRKENNKYKKHEKRSAEGWFDYIFFIVIRILIIIAFPVITFIYRPDFPYPELPLGFSAVLFLLFLHAYLTSANFAARMVLKKYLKEQDEI